MKDETIVVRINKEFKETMSKKAKKYGLTMSSYIKMLIMKDLNNE